MQEPQYQVQQQQQSSASSDETESDDDDDSTSEDENDEEEGEDMKELPSESVDLIFTDPPYADYVPYFEQSLLWASWLKKDIDFKGEIVISNSKEREKNKKAFNFRWLRLSLGEAKKVFLNMIEELELMKESLELASDSELMESLKKSEEQIKSGDVVDFDDL